MGSIFFGQFRRVADRAGQVGEGLLDVAFLPRQGARDAGEVAQRVADRADIVRAQQRPGDLR